MLVMITSGWGIYSSKPLPPDPIIEVGLAKPSH